MLYRMSPSFIGAPFGVVTCFRLNTLTDIRSFVSFGNEVFGGNLCPRGNSKNNFQFIHERVTPVFMGAEGCE